MGWTIGPFLFIPRCRDRDPGGPPANASPLSGDDLPSKPPSMLLGATASPSTLIRTFSEALEEVRVRGHMRRRGDAWELRAYVGVDPVTGRQKYKTRTFRGGKREAEAELARFVTQVSGGGHGAGDTTLADLIERWLDLAREDLSPSTLRGYERIIRSYIRPTIGKVPLNKLRTHQLDRFYAQLRESGGEQEGPLSPATVRQTHTIIRRALNQAHRWGWIAANPAALASPPSVPSRSVNPPEPQGVLELTVGGRGLRSGTGLFPLAGRDHGARGARCARCDGPTSTSARGQCSLLVPWSRAGDRSSSRRTPRRTPLVGSRSTRGP